MVTLAALTGLRAGELLALRWKMVDLVEGTIRISESVFHGQVQLPKSERSIRTIPIGPQTRILLEEHRQRFAIKRREEDLLFPNQLGGPHRESNLLERALRPAAKAAGLERVTWHQFRHIHASVLHDIGVPAKIAQQQLGHATVETTLNFYTHAIPDTHRRAIESLEEALFPNVPKLGILAKKRKLQSTDSKREAWRRGWDSNPRMEVLQTSPLGHLGTAPNL